MGSNSSLTRNEKIKNLATRVEELEVSTRTRRCFEKRNISRVYNLCETTEAEILKTGGFGRKTLNEIKEVLGCLGLQLGMRFDGETYDQFKEYLATGKLPEVPADPDSEAAADALVSDPPATKPGKYSSLLKAAHAWAIQKRMELEGERQELNVLLSAIQNGLSVSITDKTSASLRRFMEAHGQNLTVGIISKRISDLYEKLERVDSVTRRRKDGSAFDHVIKAMLLLEE